MSQFILPNNHIIYSSSSEIKAICHTLFKLGHFNYFHFYRLYKNNQLVVLLTNPSWAKHFFTKEIAIEAPTPNFAFEKKNYISLWQENIDDAIVRDALQFNINVPISFIERHETYYDEYAFGIKNNHDASFDFYLNNIESIKKFIAFFKERAKSLILEAEAQPIIVPNSMQDPKIDLLLCHDKLKKNKLTNREIDALLWAARGKTLWETAKILGISEYTVREYTSSMIKKLKANSKTEAVAKAIVFEIISHDEVASYYMT